MADNSYDKQWRWKRASIRKAEKMRAQAEDNVGTFAPHIYTSHFQSYKDGTADSAARNKAERQAAAMAAPDFPDNRIQMTKSNEMYPGFNMTQTAGKEAQLEDHQDADLSSTSDSDEPIVELLERERRQWQGEREKLIQCIHLQQLELAQRNLAAQEKAVDIAKDFAKVIESFEERLINIETHVQREITSLKSIAEALLAALGKTNNGMTL